MKPEMFFHYHHRMPIFRIGGIHSGVTTLIDSKTSATLQIDPHASSRIKRSIAIGFPCEVSALCDKECVRAATRRFTTGAAWRLSGNFSSYGFQQDYRLPYDVS